jgi:group I intron endonuclease
MGYIYILTSPSGKSYIGQTIRPIEKRLEEHRKGQSSGCRAFYNAIQMYGWDNFEKDWYECPDEDLNFDEELLVREIGTLAPNGYNLREGGGNGKPSEESRQKMSEAHIGKSLSEGHVQNMRKPKSEGHVQNMRLPKSEEHKRNISESSVGKILSEEHKRKISEARRGVKNHNSKKVYQYGLEGNFIGSFGSCEEAARHLGEKYGSAISMCARSKIKTAYNFKWSYSIV